MPTRKPAAPKLMKDAPRRLWPWPCPGCGHMPALATIKEVLGGLLATTGVRVQCANRKCPERLRTRMQGGPTDTWTEAKARRLEKVVLKEWNDVVVPDAVARLGGIFPRSTRTARPTSQAAAAAH